MSSACSARALEARLALMLSADPLPDHVIALEAPTMPGA